MDCKCLKRDTSSVVLVRRWSHIFPSFILIQPGQSFSFICKNVKGQKVLAPKDVEGAEPIVRPFDRL